MSWKIVYLSMPVHEHVDPTLPIVRELVQRGMRVDYFALERFRDAIRETGAVFHTYSPRFTIADREPGAFVDPETIVDMLLELTEGVLEDDLERIRSLEPSCVMHDSLAGWGRHVAQVLELPEVASVAAFAVDGSQILPAQSADSPHLVPMPQKTAKTPGWIARLTALNQRFGISGIDDPLELMQSFGELSLVYASKASQPQTQLLDEQRFKFIGTTVSSDSGGPPCAAGGARRGADEIEAFLARKAGSAIISSWLTTWTLRHGAGEFILPFGWIAKP